MKKKRKDVNYLLLKISNKKRIKIKRKKRKKERETQKKI